VQAELHVPLARLERSGHVPGGGGILGDDEAAAGTAGPAAPSGRARAAEIDHRAVVVLERDLDAPFTVELERNSPDLLGELVLETEPQRADLARHHHHPSTRSKPSRS